MDSQRRTEFEIRVKHSHSPLVEYTWQIHSADQVLPVSESAIGYGSWEEASQAGKLALTKFIGHRR
jgi:hypothetical protein